MPVRSLNSSVLKWPSKEEVIGALVEWAKSLGRAFPEIKRIGYFGSYARGDWGVGSDLDVIIVLERSEEPFLKRGLRYDFSTLPVPVDLLVYTEDEIESLRGSRFYQVLEREVVWLYGKD